MPYRKTPIALNEIYHIFNRSIAQQPIFLSSRDYQRAIEVLTFYQYKKPSLRFSFYNRLPKEQKDGFFVKLARENKPLIEIISFCLMPNHIHFLLKNLQENGINRFMGNFQNSYAKYFDTKTNRSGGLFQAMFKAVRIESDEQLLHVSRYIHLNPVTAYLIRPGELKNYQWSSYPDYLHPDKSSNYIHKDLILSHFKSAKAYEQFVLDQVDYQRELDKIKHLTLKT